VRGCFVTGTDTGVGKTVLTAAIVASLRARGLGVRPLKPLITGLDEPPDPDWPPDHELRAWAAGRRPEEVALFSFGPPVSPHLAAALAGRPLDPRALHEAVSRAAAGAEVAVIEGVGGLLVPLADGYDVRDLARDLGLPVLVAARPALGTINHTLLTLEAARATGLRVAGVVMTPWPSAPGEIECSNRDTVARLGSVTVSVLRPIARADPGLLADAARGLPIDDWIGESGHA
jgi:dethiobiotin synthetase